MLLPSGSRFGGVFLSQGKEEQLANKKAFTQSAVIATEICDGEAAVTVTVKVKSPTEALAVNAKKDLEDAVKKAIDNLAQVVPAV